METTETNPVEEAKTTNFFTTLAPLLANGIDLTLTFRKQDDKLVVGVRPQRTDVSKLDGIRPMVLTHSATDLDESFFLTITQPLMKLDKTADEIKAFEAEVEKAKEEATKKKTTTTTTKKPDQAKNPDPKVAAAEAKKEAEAKKKKEQEEKKTDEVKEYLALARTELNNSPASALEIITKGLKIGKDLPFVKGIVEELEALKVEAETKVLEVTLKPIIERAEANLKSANFGECGKALKEIFKLVPDHVKANEIKAELVSKLGEGFVNQLLSK